MNDPKLKLAMARLLPDIHCSEDSCDLCKQNRFISDLILSAAEQLTEKDL